jgi:hypothetical protein
MGNFESKQENNESIEKIKPKGIIAGIPGIGKTEFVKNYSDRINVFDFDSSDYKSDPSWPKNYIDLIEEKIQETELLLISSYPEVVKELISRGHEITVVCADENLKDEYRERYVSRDNQPDTVDRFIAAAFSSNEDQTKRFEGSRVVFLKKGQFLSDVIDVRE